MQRIAVAGATGRTGSRVVALALARGYQVTALARRLDAGFDGRVHVVRGDARDSAAVAELAAEADVVISALGVGASRRPTTLYSDFAAALAAVGGSQRFVVVSAAPVGPSADQPLLRRRLSYAILRRIFGASYADMRRMEEILTASTLRWTALRPPRLVDGPGRGAYRIGVEGPPPGGASITHDDLAAALLDVGTCSDLVGRAIYVSG